MAPRVAAFSVRWIDGGERVAVLISPDSMDAFRHVWPCSGFPKATALALVLDSRTLDTASAPDWFVGDAAQAMMPRIRDAVRAVAAIHSDNRIFPYPVGA